MYSPRCAGLVWIICNEPQLLRGGPRLAAAAHTQLAQHTAHMGLDRGEPDVQYLPDLRVALVGADQPQHLQLRRRQRIAHGQPRLQEPGIDGGLCPHIRHQPLVPLGVPCPRQRIQQRQYCRAVDADGADETVFLRQLQRLRQYLAPPLVLLAVQGDGGQHSEVYGVDIAHAGGAVRLHGRKGQQGAVRLAVGQLHHCLGEVLVPLEDVDVCRLPRCLGAVPHVGLVQVAGMERDAAEHGVHVGQKTCQFPLLKLAAQVGDGLSRVRALPACQQAPRQQTADGELDVRRAAAADVIHALHKGEHPRRDILAFFKLAFGDGAVGKAHAVPPEDGLHRDTHGAVEQVILFAPEGEVLAAVHDAGQSAGNGE